MDFDECFCQINSSIEIYNIENTTETQNAFAVQSQKSNWKHIKNVSNKHRHMRRNIRSGDAVRFFAFLRN